MPRRALSGISEYIWNEKYRLKDNHGEPIDDTVDDTFTRVARALASAEKESEQERWAGEFYDAMADFEVIPAGRILAGAGSERAVTLMNCYVTGTVPDSLHGIQNMLTESALTLQQGGGIGTDFSTIRPKGALITKLGSTASGPLSFMDQWDAMCRSIMSAGHRRGAMMGTLRCDHPDIEAFIEAKRDGRRFRMFNLSVLVTDLFMQAVEHDAPWELKFKDKVFSTIRARDLWDKIMRSTYEYADPGVIFIDRVNKANPLRNIETISCSNPCFTGDTLVWTLSGPRPFMELAQSGGTVPVLTMTDGGEVVFRDMTKPRMTKRQAKLVEVTLRGSDRHHKEQTKVRCTPTHEFHLTDGRRVAASNLRPGDSVISAYLSNGNTQPDDRAIKQLRASGLSLAAIAEKLGCSTYMAAHRLGWQRPNHKVVLVRPVEQCEDVYCGTVEETGRFFIVTGEGEGVLVSNCGEQLLPPYAPCDLGSINLAKFVTRPFTMDASFNWNRLEKLTAVLVRMLDNVLDVTNYPLEKQRTESLSKRRIGIGVTGLADCLAMLGQKYSSPFAVEFTGLACKGIRAAAEAATYELGAEKGSFPLFNPAFYPEQPVYRRNSHLMSIAPTGTISLFAGNVSSGIEPIFDLSLKRRILQKNDTWKEVEIRDYAWDRYHTDVDTAGVEIDTGVWETAAKLEPEAHINILAAAQQHIDSSVSKTINCPAAISFEAFKDIYARAYSLGAKSCTTYRPNAITGSILSSDSMTAEKGGTEMGKVVELSKPLVRPTQLVGSTYRLKPTNVEHALFITINDIIEENGRRRPYEVFINTKSLEFVAWTTALTVMISAIFRKGGDVSFVGEELKAIFDPRGGYWEGKAYVPSIIAGIGGVIEEHLTNLGQERKVAPAGRKECPSCHADMVQKEGCWSCSSCTYSMCG